MKGNTSNTTHHIIFFVLYIIHHHTRCNSNIADITCWTEDWSNWSLLAQNFKTAQFLAGGRINHVHHSQCHSSGWSRSCQRLRFFPHRLRFGCISSKQDVIMVTLMKRFQNPSDREISAWNWTSWAEISTCQCLQSPHRRHHIAPLHTSSTGSWSSGSTKSIPIASIVTCGTWLTWLDFQENIWQSWLRRSPINWKNRTVQSLVSTCSATNSRFSVSYGLWLFFQSCHKENLNFISIGFWVLSKSNIVLQFANILCLCAKRPKDVFWQLRMFGKRCRVSPDMRPKC